MRSRLLALAVGLCAAATALVGTPTPAHAATADLYGFAYVKDPTVPIWTTLDTSRQWGTWKGAFPGSWAEGGKLAPGRFLVKFPHIGLGARGNVHVTPINRTGHYCEIVRWDQSGTDEIIDVQCHRPGGARDDTPFVVMWTFSSGVLPPGQGSYASVQYGTFGIVQSYNSTGGAVSVVPFGVGAYEVRFDGVGSGVLSGSVLTTAIQPNASPRRCKIRKWGDAGPDIVAYVFCYDATGAQVDTEFTASYHRERSVFASFGPPKYFGYLASASGGETNFNYPAGGFGFNSFGPVAPPGRYLVKYPWLGLAETHAQVVAHGAGPNYCHLTQPWLILGGDVQVDVLCFDNAGMPLPHDFLSTFTSRA